MATIYDVAEKAGVSTSTVSRVLNGSSLIGPEVANKVKVAAGELGYQKRQVKRHVERAILNIKLVLPQHDAATKNLFYDFSELADGLREGLAPAKLNLLTDTLGRGFDPFPHKKGGDIDAFVFAFHRPSKRVLEEIQGRKIPYMIINRDVPKSPWVSADHAHGIELLMAYLVEKESPKKFCFIGYEGIDDVYTKRSEAYLKQVSRFGIDALPPQMVCSSPDRLKGEALQDLLSKGVRTFLCVNDILAAVVIQQLRILGKSVPGEVRVTGFDNSPVREIVLPSLTTVSLPVQQLGKEAGKMINAAVIKHLEIPESLLLKGELLRGETA